MPEQRKTVTILFCDLAGSTALGETLDPEQLRALLARYFERMRRIVEHHGGSVEKFIGDAVMAVFGVPAVHEDDALRAVRAALEMRDALPGLGLEGRIGVMTGEVVTGTEERLATGDAVNVAARLEQAAAPGEVLIGGPTRLLVAEAVELEAVEPLVLKGKTDPVAAYRLLRVLEMPERRHDSPFVGRDGELAMVREAWQRVQAERCCELVTMVGEAGVGKSRLVAEALTSIDARVVRGRCIPYGEGITYWPVVEVLKQLDSEPADEAAAVAIRSLLGESEAATSAEEIAWAFRKTLEHAAAERPLVVVFDDIQWGEQTFHDLIEHVALLSTGAALLLLCMARPELVERRPTWPVTLRLGSLGDDDVQQLIPADVADELRRRIAAAASGNPFFVGEILAMTAGADGEVVVPPTLQALLAARLDQLEAAERNILELGTIEGETFHRGAVQALAPDELRVTPQLAALVRKELIRPDRSRLIGEDGFRFRHLLIRDAAYDALPKAVRADLHRRFASWLEQRGADLVEADELVGYHLEQACTFDTELGQTDDEVAAEARRRLTAAALRAASRNDFGGATHLFERATALLRPEDVDIALELQLAESLHEIGRTADARARAEAVAARAAARGDGVGELCGRLKAAVMDIHLEPEGATDRLDALVSEALPTLQVADDDVALHTVYAAGAWAAVVRGRTDTALDGYEQAALHARAAGLPNEYVGWRGLCRLYGSTPVRDVMAWLEEHDNGQDLWLRAARGMCLAMLGRFDEARAILEETRTALAERGATQRLGVITGIESAAVEITAGNLDRAAELGAEGCRILEELGDEAFLSYATARLANTLVGLGRIDEAGELARRAAEMGARDDAFNQMMLLRAEAKVLARRGALEASERLLREAVEIGETTDDPIEQADAFSDFAGVLLESGRRDDAAAAFANALERYERKGNLVMAERTRARLAELATADSG